MTVPVPSDGRECAVVVRGEGWLDERGEGNARESRRVGKERCRGDGRLKAEVEEEERMAPGTEEAIRERGEILGDRFHFDGLFVRRRKLWKIARGSSFNSCCCFASTYQICASFWKIFSYLAENSFVSFSNRLEDQPN